MFFLSRTTLALSAFAAISLTAAGPQAAHAQDVITFDNFASEPSQNGLSPLAAANGNNSTYDSVTFSSNAFVVGNQFAPNGVPLVTTHSGNYAFTPGAVQTTTLLTTKTLYGLYLGQVGAGNAAASVTVNALGAYNMAEGSYTILGSTAADALTGTTLSFFDTSSLASLASLPTFSGYSLVSQGAAGAPNFDFAGDDFTFSPIAPAPPPPVTAKFDFDTDSVGTNPQPQNTRTAFSDVSNGITATFSSAYDKTNGGGFGILGLGTAAGGFSGNALVETNTRYTPLSIAFDHTLGQGSIAFNDNSSSGQGVFTVQETLNGLDVGAPVTSSTFGTVSFGGTSFNGLLLSDTASQFAIDNLDVMGMSPVPEASTTVSLGLLLAFGLGGMVIAKRKKARTA